MTRMTRYVLLSVVLLLAVGIWVGCVFQADEQTDAGERLDGQTEATDVGETETTDTSGERDDAEGRRGVDVGDGDAEQQDDASNFQPGESYESETGYVEYIAGDTPIVVSVPHGGYDEPEEIDDRRGTTVRDQYTLELGREFAEAFYEHTGRHVHLISLELARTKLDANRDLDTAAQGDPLAEEVWHEFHEFIEISKDWAVDHYDAGFYVDLHGHGHLLQRIELGYLLTGDDLREDDDELDASEYVDESSVRTLYEGYDGDIRFSELIRGDESLGALLADRGYSSVPSPDIEAPEWYSPFFSGGYNTDRHGSVDGGLVSGVQIEANQNLRFEEEDRLEFADGLATALNEFVSRHYGWEF